MVDFNSELSDFISRLYLNKEVFTYVIVGMGSALVAVSAIAYGIIKPSQQRHFRLLQEELGQYGISPDGLNYERIKRIGAAKIRGEAAEPELRSIFDKYFVDRERVGKQQARQNFWTNPKVINYIKPVPE